MTPKEILVAAKALIATPDKWTQDAGGRDANGNRVMPTDQSAVCFCAIGALFSIAGEDGGDYAEEAWIVFSRANNLGMPAEEWNDHPDTNHAKVMAAYDKAIANA